MVSLLLTSNLFHPFFSYFYYWLWPDKCFLSSKQDDYLVMLSKNSTKYLFHFIPCQIWKIHEAGNFVMHQWETLMFSARIERDHSMQCVNIIKYRRHPLNDLQSFHWRNRLQTPLLILTLSWWRPLSYRNQSIDLQSKSMDWFLYDNNLLHERVKRI